MELGLAGRVALVTASSKGLGFAAARALASEGCAVSINARHAETLERAANVLREAGAEVFAQHCDVTEASSATELVDRTVGHFGRLDILVANAGGPPQGRAFDVDDESLNAAINANLLTSVRLARAAVPHLARGGWGRICFIASYSVVQPLPNLALSNTARVGLWGWAKTAAADLAAGDRTQAITLNLACPGPHATDRMIQLGASGGTGPMGDPDDFGKVVAFLCSEPAAFVNGAAIVVDGGQTLAL